MVKDIIRIQKRILNFSYLYNRNLLGSSTYPKKTHCFNYLRIDYHKMKNFTHIVSYNRITNSLVQIYDMQLKLFDI